MSDTISSRLAKLGISIPQAAAPVANYVAAAQSGNQLFISGQLPLDNGKLLSIGKAGAQADAAMAKKAAQACAINILAQAHLGNLDKIKRIVKITTFVAATPEFTDIPSVANGASDLFVSILGETAGRHARSAVGVATLPMNATVEVEAILEI